MEQTTKGAVVLAGTGSKIENGVNVGSITACIMKAEHYNKLDSDSQKRVNDLVQNSNIRIESGTNCVIKGNCNINCHAALFG